MKPNDQRGFIHKRIIGAASGFLSGGFTGAAGGFLGGGGGRSGGQPVSGAAKHFGHGHTGSTPGHDFSTRSGLAAGQGGCQAGRIRIAGKCVKFGAALPGGVPFTTPVGGVGQAVMGQFGAGLQPFVENRMVRECLPGMVLGKDGLCYNRSDISNKNREWPRGRRPLGTPGEMAALAKAASFGRRMENTVKRMQKIGVLKKPSRGHSRRPRRLAPGSGVSVVNVE